VRDVPGVSRCDGRGNVGRGEKFFVPTVIYEMRNMGDYCNIILYIYNKNKGVNMIKETPTIMGKDSNVQNILNGTKRFEFNTLL